MRRRRRGFTAGVMPLLALGAAGCGAAPMGAGVRSGGAAPRSGGGLGSDGAVRSGVAASIRPRRSPEGAKRAATTADGGAAIPAGPERLRGRPEPTRLQVRSPPTLRRPDAGAVRSPPADVVVPTSTAPTADTDGDGVSDALDFCPGTPAGAAVDSVGCSADQRAALSMVTITLDPHSKLPIVFKASASDVAYIATGIVVNGKMLLETALGEVPIFGTRATFGYAPGTSDVVTVAGTTQVPLPHDGRFGKFSIATPSLAQMGYGPGSGVTQEEGDETPIEPTTNYLYFDTTGGFGIEYGAMSIDGPGGSQRIFIDPSDPFFFENGEVSGIPKIGKAALGVGISGHGNLDFAPNFQPGTPDDIQKKVQPFNADLLLTGHVPLAELPLAIEGRVYYGVTTDDQGAPTHVNMGANDTLFLSFDFIHKLIGFEVPIVHATFGASLGEGTDTAFFSGLASADNSFMPSWVPIKYAAALDISGVVSTDVSQTSITATGNLSLAGSSLSDMCGVDLQDLALLKASVGIDQTGFRVSGSATAAISGKFSVDGTATVTSFFGGDPDAWYLQMKGGVAIEGFHLASASAYVDHTGLTVNGSLKTPVTSISLGGSITNAGVDLEGDASVHIPVSGLVPTVVTDAAICGYEGGETVAECTGNVIANCAKSIFHGHKCKKPKCIIATCNQTTVRSLGDIEGSVHLALGNSGIQGSLEGELLRSTARAQASRGASTSRPAAWRTSRCASRPFPACRARSAPTCDLLRVTGDELHERNDSGSIAKRRIHRWTCIRVLPIARATSLTLPRDDRSAVTRESRSSASPGPSSRGSSRGSEGGRGRRRARWAQRRRSARGARRSCEAARRGEGAPGCATAR